MKVLMINGSPRPDGNTTLALKEMEQLFAKNGIETETIQIWMKDIQRLISPAGPAMKNANVFLTCR